MSLIQLYGGREHTSTSTLFSTNVHGPVGSLFSLSGVKGSVESKPVKVLGSSYPVAWGAPEGELPKLTLKIMWSGQKDFEKQLRQFYGLTNPAFRIELAQLRMSCRLISAPVDGNEAALPTVGHAFDAFYLGCDIGGSDRSNTDPMMLEVFLQQITPERSL